jgi:nitrate/TMAO reductase-like tetraheme cytochrome c subunit
MRTRTLLLITVIAGALFFAMAGWAKSDKEKNDAPSTGSSTTSTHPKMDEASRLEGEKRFRANCGRCHNAPSKFPPRMMATVIRHMRVRATITDQDMRLILGYMTE